MLATALLGIAITHAFRAVIIKYKWIEKPFESVAIYFFLGIVICATIDSFVLSAVYYGLNLTYFDVNFNDTWLKTFIQQTTFISLWAVIYFL